MNIHESSVECVFSGVRVKSSNPTGAFAQVWLPCTAAPDPRCQVTRFLIRDQMQIFLPEQTLATWYFEKIMITNLVGGLNPSEKY